MRLLSDTNVLVDYFGGRHPFFEEWELINAMQIAGYAELWASAESYTDAFYLLHKAVGSARLQEMFVESLECIRVCSLGEEDICEAAGRSWDDFEDCLIDVCAEKVKADYIITRDKSGFSRSKIPAYAPKAFFEHLEHDHGLVFELTDF